MSGLVAKTPPNIPLPTVPQPVPYLQQGGGGHFCWSTVGGAALLRATEQHHTKQRVSLIGWAVPVVQGWDLGKRRQKRTDVLPPWRSWKPVAQAPGSDWSACWPPAG